MFRLLAVVAILTVAVIAESRADAPPATVPALLPPDFMVSSFDRDVDLPPTATPSARISRDVESARGAGSLKVTFHASDPVVTPVVRLPLVGGIDAKRTGQLSLQIRATAGPGVKDVRVRISLFNAKGHSILRRHLFIPPGGQWRGVDIGLERFLWGEIAGGWDEVRAMEFAIETPFTAVWIDEVKLMPRPAEGPSAADQLRRLAFGDRDARTAEADGLLVATDAVDLTEGDVTRLLGNMRRSQAVVRRLFGSAVRPIEDPSPTALLVFKDQPSYAAFWQTMGRQWGVRIVPPQAGGYAVQDLATSFYDPELGNDRPVWLHESVHAIMAHNLRLSPGSPQHSWIQEGVANYIQLCVYPQALQPAALQKMFAAGVQDQPEAVFRPLRSVLTERVPPRHYAQVASLTAYLVEEKPQWLPTLAEQLAEGKPVETTLRDLGSDFGSLENDWLRWGRKRFDRPREDGHFAPLPEWEARK